MPELREFVRENEERVYNFCYYMLGFTEGCEDLIYTIFRQFGRRYRDIKGRSKPLPMDNRIQLFQIAWSEVRHTLSTRRPAEFEEGRDTRNMENLGEDLLLLVEKGTPSKRDLEAKAGALHRRLLSVDPDFRAPLILKDVLKFSDEEVVKILALRWGVYRHRLHRGRIEFMEALTGRTSVLGPPGSSREASTGKRF